MIPFPNRSKWKRLLSKHYSVKFTEDVIIDASKIYDDLLKVSSTRIKNNHRFTKNRIFPILALYRSILKHRSDNKSTLHEMEALMIEMYYKVEIQGIKRLDRILPDPFTIIKPLLTSMVRFSDLPQGQVVKENNPDCFAIDIHQCFIFDTLQCLNAPELTTIFCASDDILSAAMTKIEWRRTQTLGRGGEKCDFCWCRKKPSP